MGCYKWGKVLLRRLCYWFFLGFLGVSSSVQASAVVNAFKLNNGMEVRIKQDHRSPVVLTQVWYKVGSSYESTGFTGISHLLEHMMFRGTLKVGPGEFSQIISRLGGVENAFTAEDFTAYYQMMPADKLETSLRLEADRMRNLQLKYNDFLKERQIVMEERRMRVDDVPQARAYERFLAVAHTASAYHHPTIGWPGDLNRLRLDDLRAWYSKWYAPNNAILVIVGDVDPEQAKKLVQRYFAGMSPKPIPKVIPQEEVTPLGKRHLTLHIAAKVPWLIMGYNVPVIKTAKKAWEPYALYVLAALMDAGASARFPKNLVRDRAIAVAASANYHPFDRLDSLFTISAVPSQGHSLPELQAAIATEIKRLQTELVSATELSRVKAQAIAARVFAEDTLSSQALNIGALESVGLSWRDYDVFLKHLNAVTAEQVRLVARRYLTDTRLTMGELIPQALEATA